MKHLYTGDLSGFTEAAVIDHVVQAYQEDISVVKKYRFLIACEHEDSYDGSSYFLLKDKKTGDLFEVHGGHCSCYGFEGQFKPEGTTIDYLQSEHYPNRSDAAIKEFVDAL